MTDRKHLKARIRARMAKTGERYTTARLHVLGPDVPGAPDASPASDDGYRLWGGVFPESATLTNVLAHLGVTGLTEPILFGAAGGLGAGYILWEFKEHDAPVLTLGFSNRWQYSRGWADKALDRLGVAYDWHTTSGARGASARLDEALAAGEPAIVLPDRQISGYWYLPGHLEGHGGHPVVAYAERDGRVCLDDRNLVPLSVERERFDRARARVVSYENQLLVLRPERTELPLDVVRRAVEEGLRDCATNLAGTSTSFALPAWRKWARLITDRRNAKGWPRVFADRHGLVGALLSVWEGVEPMGMTGGHLRGLYADFLDQSADLVANRLLADCAQRFREAAELWHEVAETALPADVPTFARMRDLTSTVQESITAAGDDGAAEAAEAASELWALRAEADRTLPLDDAEIEELLATLSARISAVYRLEVDAAALLAKALPV